MQRQRLAADFEKAVLVLLMLDNYRNWVKFGQQFAPSSSRLHHPNKMLAVACIFRNNFHNTPYPHLVHAVDLGTPLFEPLILLLQINLNMRSATQIETSGLSISEVQSQLLARSSLFNLFHI